MTNYSRRKFIKKSALAVPGLILLHDNVNITGFTTYNSLSKNIIKVLIPLPLQVVIDDVGWWSGEDGSKRQEPYRTGINRNHVPADYLAIADLGRSLGIRPEAATVLCEWDRENILRGVPTATWMGEKWDNSKWVGPWLEEAAEIIRNNRGYYEITIHGIGHEYWEDGAFTRAEWTDSKGQMRPADQVEKHLEFYARLMEQNNLGSLPASFVPAAFRHCFGKSEGRDISLAEILLKHGVNYINTPFSSIYNGASLKGSLFGFDSEIITIDRGDDQFQWDIFPGDPEAVLKGPTCGLHWPNLLHPDPDRNPEIVERWVNYLKPYNDRPDMILAPDSVYFQHQLVHSQLTKTIVKGNHIDFDFTETDKLPRDLGKKTITVKIQSARPLKLWSDIMRINSVSLDKQESFLYTINAERMEGRKRGRINFESDNPGCIIS